MINLTISKIFMSQDINNIFDNMFEVCWHFWLCFWKAYLRHLQNFCCYFTTKDRSQVLSSTPFRKQLKVFTSGRGFHLCYSPRSHHSNDLSKLPKDYFMYIHQKQVVSKFVVFLLLKFNFFLSQYLISFTSYKKTFYK